ncbi:Tyrosine-protein kinase csk-1 [Lamellibrachia satsuma]|nr:Tyrosine-protein kinase csk-1 [Lamellibrachia satsuma]
MRTGSRPILLFELCDLGRLNDWLAAQTQLTEELQDNMITFSLQIARGMKHLHAHKIVHRRLGARNVLLKSDDVGGIVAKVAGFGPTKGEVQGGENDSAEGKIPVKWMAPEQLNLEPGAKRKHDAKTDIWSFGVTLWEIFSKGETPYSDCVSGEVTAMLSTGYRMPRPTHCPDMMFDRVVTPCWAGSAISRPSFAGVVTTIETVFLTGGGGDEYYYERTEDLPEHGYDNNTYEPTF